MWITCHFRSLKHSNSVTCVTLSGGTHPDRSQDIHSSVLTGKHQILQNVNLLSTKLHLTDLKTGFHLSFITVKLHPPLPKRSFPRKKVLIPYASEETAPYLFLIINCLLSKDTFMSFRKSMIPT